MDKIYKMNTSANLAACVVCGLSLAVVQTSFIPESSLWHGIEALSKWECVKTGGEFTGVCCNLQDGSGKMCIDLPGNYTDRDCVSDKYFNDK